MVCGATNGPVIGYSHTSLSCCSISGHDLRALARAVSIAWTTVDPTVHITHLLISFKLLFKCHFLEVSFLISFSSNFLSLMSDQLFCFITYVTLGYCTTYLLNEKK